ncbi:hypothetical protein PMAYCL1PPCAC_20225, partial [Pristionchus mayeri]
HHQQQQQKERHHEQPLARRDSLTSAGSALRALEAMDDALQHDNSDDGGSTLNGSVHSKQHHERLVSYSRSSSKPVPPPPVSLWDLIMEDEAVRGENVRDTPAPLQRAGPTSHPLEIPTKNTAKSTGADDVNDDVHRHETAVEAVTIADRIVHDSKSQQRAVRSTSYRYGSKHAPVEESIGAGTRPATAAAAAYGAVVEPPKKHTADSNHTVCKHHGAELTFVEDRAYGSTLTETNVTGAHVHQQRPKTEHHNGEVVAAHIIQDHIERRAEEEIAKEIGHQELQQESSIEYEHQMPVASLLYKFGGGKKKTACKNDAEVRRRWLEDCRRVEQARRVEEDDRRQYLEDAHWALDDNEAEEARLAASRAAAQGNPFATLTRPPPQQHVIPGYARNPMTSP